MAIELSSIPTTKSYERNASGYAPDECCARCGKHMPDATLFLITSQGLFALGSDCQRSLIKAKVITAADCETSEPAAVAS